MGIVGTGTYGIVRLASLKRPSIAPESPDDASLTEPHSNRSSEQSRVKPLFQRFAIKAIPRDSCDKVWIANELKAL